MGRTKLNTATVAVVAMAGLGSVHAADAPPAVIVAQASGPAPYSVYGATPVFSWTGLYVGYNLGAGWNTQKTVSNFASPWSTTNIAFIGGLQAGYNYQLGKFVLGVEADVDLISGTGRQGSSGPGPVGLARTTGQWNWTSSLSGRFGFAADCTLFYGKVGYAWVAQTLAINSAIAFDTTTTFVSSTTGGQLIGGGIEYLFPGSAWTAKIEYDYVVMASRSFVVSIPNTVTVTPNLQMLKVGFNYKM